MKFALTHMAMKWWPTGQGRPAIVYGPQRKGKSSYSLQVALDLIAETGNTWDYRQLVVYHPRDFLKKLSDLTEKGERAPVLIWDDAGVWLFALDWSQNFIKAVAKVLQVSATAVCLLIFTTPTPSMIIRRVRELEGVLYVKITQPDTRHTWARVAKIMRITSNPLGYKTVKLLAEDYYNVLLPNEIYNWYWPLRQSYLQEATRVALNKLQETLGTEEAGDFTRADDVIDKMALLSSPAP